MTLKLVFPDETFSELWNDLMNSFKIVGERPSPGAIRIKDNDFSLFLKRVNDYRDNKDLPVGMVPSTTYFLVDENMDKILGGISIRHELNDELFQFDGNIGYGINPFYRRKGYGSKMLSLALNKCVEMGFKKVLITCNKDNVPSRKTILNNGGIKENEVTEQDGNIVERYWIKL